MFDYQKIVERIFIKAGITINGDRPYDIRVHDERFYKRFLRNGRLALGESYMDGWWDCQKIDEMVYRLFDHGLVDAMEFKTWEFYLTVIKARIFPEGARSRSHLVGEKHYDIGNDLYQAMLDKRMMYTCGYWAGAHNLDEAQQAKLELTCRKLKLRPGMTVLDVGCGWGGFAKYAAEKHQVQVTGITISQEQLELGKKICSGLPVELKFQDYRDVKGSFDRIVSLGMFEHVGKKYYKTYMAKMNACLCDDGLFLLHTIGINASDLRNDWLNKYIFPGAKLPSLKDIAEAAESKFMLEDFQNIGPHYDQTLMAWYDNFIRNWDRVKMRFDERFFRMWCFFLLSCAGSFRARQSQLWQLVFSKEGFRGRYEYDGNYLVHGRE